MTLNTAFVIGKVDDPKETASAVYFVCREMLGTPDHIKPIRSTGDTYDLKGTENIDHPGGVGLPAWLMMKYWPNGPRVVKPEDYTNPEWFDLEYAMDNPFTNGFASIQVNWDTAYGYRGPNSESCSDLHALYVAVLGQWCDKRGIDWMWHNEYTCEWHEKRHGLEEFRDMHDKPGGANDWFKSLDLEAIVKKIGEEYR